MGTHHHGRGEYGDCGCGAHKGHHGGGHGGQYYGGCSCGGHHYGGCSCSCHHGGHSGACCEGDSTPRLQRRFYSRQERTGDLEGYLRDLEAEIQGVREALAREGGQ
jgi:hypothetical protein